MPRLAPLLLLLVAHAAHAQGNDPPVAGRPAEFSQIVGRYILDATADPSTVAVEEPITLRVAITGQGPAAWAPQRKRLKLFPPGFDEQFYVEAGEDTIDAADGRWEFVYRLRPKHARVREIGPLTLVTYDPAARKYQTQVVEVPIAVRPRAGPQLDPWTMPAATFPAMFDDLAPADALFVAPPVSPSSGWLVALLLGPPLSCWLGAWAWRRCYPDAVARARRRRSEAARRALTSTDPPWAAVAQYLRERLGYPGAEPTPAEVAAFLKRRGFPRALGQQAWAFLAACAAARFAPHAGEETSLRAAAARLIEALEAEA